MKLQTQIPLKKANDPIDYDSRLVLLGSCFVENIGEKLHYYKFRSALNPFGILFHQKAIENVVARSLRGDVYVENEIFYHNERWHSFDAHSDLSSTSKEGLLLNLNQGIETLNEDLRNCTHVLITLGTAWAYRHLETDTLVGNCHKVPQKEFAKELVSIDEIVKSLESTCKAIQAHNAEVQFIFTVSPVRHLKDGFVENQVSKAHLVCALHELLGRDGTTTGKKAYFPSYELMIDELRDYRFYKTDMVHPNQLAIDYIWDKFKDVWISEKAFSCMEEVGVIQKGLRHRPFNPKSQQYIAFVKSLREKITKIRKQHPFIEFDLAAFDAIGMG
ncbi:MAG: GSCFA domain-containing protein [Maribacter sp.]|nr:GSCFA domain-containing protein [Maribacter sp.]